MKVKERKKAGKGKRKGKRLDKGNASKVKDKGRKEDGQLLLEAQATNEDVDVGGGVELKIRVDKAGLIESVSWQRQDFVSNIHTVCPCYNAWV